MSRHEDLGAELVAGEPQHCELVGADLGSQLDEFSIVGGSQTSRGREVDNKHCGNIRVKGEIHLLACTNQTVSQDHISQPRAVCMHASTSREHAQESHGTKSRGEREGGGTVDVFGHDTGQNRGLEGGGAAAQPKGRCSSGEAAEAELCCCSGVRGEAVRHTRAQGSDEGERERRRVAQETWGGAVRTRDRQGVR